MCYPPAFSTYTLKTFLNKLKKWQLNINERIITNFRHTGDNVLLAESEQELQDLVNLVNRNTAGCELDIKINKTKTDNEKGRATMNITVNEEILEQVTSFSYLGHIITDNRSKTEI